MKIIVKFFIHLCFATFFISILYNVSNADDRPFNNAANWGGTGLIESPNARVLSDGVMRFGIAQAEPYRWYSGAMGVLPGLEVSARVTELQNVNLSESYGSYKDKCIDIKYKLPFKTKNFPAIAVGVHDIVGSVKLYPSEYIAFSQRFDSFDFTFGLGTKRLSGGANLFGIEDLGAFGGVEWNISKRFNVMVEYVPIEYEKETANHPTQPKPVPEGASSPVNVGVRAELFRGVDLGLSWQRGDTIGFMLHFNILLGKSILPKKPNPPAWRTVTPQSLSGKNIHDELNKIKNEIKGAGFDNVKVTTDGKRLTAEIQNERYISNQKAVGRVLRILLKNSPPEIERISVVLTRRKIPFLRISVSPHTLDKFIMGEMRADIFEQLVHIETITEKSIKKEIVSAKSEATNSLDYRWGVKPEFETFLNDLSGAFRYRIGIKPYATISPWKGSEFVAAYMIPFYSNVTSVNVPPPDAVRSDGWKYLGDEPALDRLYYDQTFRLGEKSFGRFSTGYFEKQYAGFGGEVMTFPSKGSFAVGLEGDWVRKRKPGNTMELFNDREYYTLLCNLYYRFRPLKMTLRAQYGRFLGEDVGWRFEASREYDTGLVLGAWYSFTDTDHFLTQENQGYNDKGIFMKLPAQMFSLREKRHRYSYRLSPWTRDVGATVAHPSNLYDIGSDLMPVLFEEDLKKLKD